MRSATRCAGTSACGAAAAVHCAPAVEGEGVLGTSVRVTVGVTVGGTVGVTVGSACARVDVGVNAQVGVRARACV